MSRTATSQASGQRQARASELQDALNTLVLHGGALAQDFSLPWTRQDAELCASLRFAWASTDGNRADAAPPPWRLIGIVGGASSGKSTLFNNLLGARHASHVTMMAHTTRGPILAVHPESESVLADFLGGDRLLLPYLERRTAKPDDRTEGGTEALTVVTVDAELSPDLLLVDTADFTSQASLREGDGTRNMLCWFTGVLVLIDEARWFDRQTFGWLRDRLDRYDLPRLVVFNRNERSGPLTDADRDRLTRQAALLRAEHLLIDYLPGRGLRSFPAESLAGIRAWLDAAEQVRSAEHRRDRLAHLLADRANACLNANHLRRGLLAQFEIALGQTLRGEMKPESALACDVLLSASQAELLSPTFQGLVRPGVWLARKSGSLFRRIPGLGMFTAPEATRDSGEAEPEDMIARGAAFFAAEVGRIANHMLRCAAHSALFKGASLSMADLEPLRPEPSAVEDEGRRLARRCNETFDRFTEAVERSAAELNLKLAASGGMLAGGVVGALLTAPAGGLGLPVGALIGAIIGGPASGLSARSLMRLYKTLARTPERRDLGEATKHYHQGMRARLDTLRQGILRLAHGKILAEDDPLHGALAVLRDRSYPEVGP